MGSDGVMMVRQMVVRGEININLNKTETKNNHQNGGHTALHELPSPRFTITLSLSMDEDGALQVIVKSMEEGGRRRVEVGDPDDKDDDEDEGTISFSPDVFNSVGRGTMLSTFFSNKSCCFFSSSSCFMIFSISLLSFSLISFSSSFRSKSSSVGSVMVNSF
jgi:hypothetical protein